ncbi:MULTISPECIES: hypothetical protein [unclassified Synechococcus]|jgi:hypothetical protein|uniref:hypothetical protein n=1 Tax=unclassified Synechococcus TaxID=2626047 RepID=UPI000B98C418|nr:MULTISPECIES: hypothetical protein [unclassified Synechococcus]MCP9829283.1 hypothetical protein [Synechococcus sp. L2F]MCP9846554.1 hypothetical protein [Synechococcus sp. Lug-A]
MGLLTLLIAALLLGGLWWTRMGAPAPPTGAAPTGPAAMDGSLRRAQEAARQQTQLETQREDAIMKPLQP